MNSRVGERAYYALNGGTVKRFHTALTLTENTVGQHSFGVAHLCHLLSTHLDATERYTLLLAALEHDLPEQEMGDLPAPAKRKLGDSAREKWRDAEAVINAEMGYGYERALSKEGARVLKLADVLEGAFYCVKERAMGNKTIQTCYSNFRSYVDEVRADQRTEIEFDSNEPAHWRAENNVISTLDDAWESVHG